jgi:hypothetical protein
LTTGAASACPQCGAPLRFGGAESLAAACAYCRAAVLRRGADLALAGKLPDLVATDTRLSLGMTGSAGGQPFTVLGRLQLSRGDATWNEWYASFPRGFGWIAEAQGRLFLTRRLPDARGLPRLGALHAGMELEIPGGGRFTVDEVDQAALASFEGELPFAPQIGAAYRYADATSADGSFATLDYGTGEDAPVLYAGRELPWSAVGLPAPTPPAAGREKAAALACPGCGGPIDLRRADSRAATCPSCHSLLDVAGGDLRVLGVLGGRARPPIPLGSKGRLRGEPLEVLGWLERRAGSAGESWAWDELLLHGPGGYRWLSHYAGHWLFLRPIPAGKVNGVQGRSYRCDGRTFKHFQTAEAVTEEIQGEFYWELRAGERIRTEDYVAPPYLLSVERTEGEVAWTRGEYLTGSEVYSAFGLPGPAPAPQGVAAAQPNPWAPRARDAWKVGGLAILALGALALLLAATTRPEIVAELDVPLEHGRVTLSEPFDLTGGSQAVAIEASAAVREAWVGLDLALIEVASGESEAVGLSLSHFSGIEGGQSWSEGSNHGRAVAGAIRAGRYLLRVEPVLEAQARGRVGPSAHVRVQRGAFLAAPLVLALLAVVAWPLLATLLLAAFEKRRWAESDHAPGASGDSSGTEEEE